jgi:type II secretory pathway component PulF
MALYFYQALSKEGKKVQGYLDAASINEVRQQLSAKALYPVSIEAAAGKSTIAWWRRIFSRGVSVKEKILFTKQLGVLIRSGVPLLQSMELLTGQFSGQLQTILVSVKDDLKEGISFADALKKYPKVFENIYVQLVRAGEASGRLEIILERLTEYLERREELRKKVKSALTYPIIQLTIALLVVGVMLVYVVPQMKDNFMGAKKQLPGATRFLVAISDFLINHLFLIIGAIGAAIASFWYWSGTPSGSRTIDRILLRIPILRFFSRTNAVVQFSQTLGMLLEGGVNLSEALDIVCNIIDNSVLADALREARDKIIKQGKIAQYLKQTGVFPPIAIYLISTGEETGKLDAMLLSVAKDYEAELAEYADSLAEKIGPILLIVMAVLVGFIVIAIALPLAQMGDVVGEM